MKTLRRFMLFMFSFLCLIGCVYWLGVILGTLVYLIANVVIGAIRGIMLGAEDMRRAVDPHSTNEPKDVPAPIDVDTQLGTFRQKD